MSDDRFAPGDGGLDTRSAAGRPDLPGANTAPDESDVSGQGTPSTSEPEGDEPEVEAALSADGPPADDSDAADESVPPDGDEAAATDADDVATTTGGRLQRLLQDDRLGWKVAAVASLAAVVFLVAAVVLGTWWAPLHTAQQDREDVREVGSAFAEQLTTFDGATIDSWVDQTQEFATAEYADEVELLFDEDLRAALADNEVSSDGTVENLFVQDIEGEAASVFAVVRQAVTNAGVDEPFEDELRMEIELRLVDDQWRIADVAVLGPARSAVPTDEAPDEQLENEGGTDE